ncbi:MAG: hypothetical protein ACE5I1_05200 [bacterium]
MPGFANYIIFRFSMKKAPKQIQRLVSRGLLDFSKKAFRQLFAGPFDENDIQNVILLGSVIKKKEMKPVKQNTNIQLSAHRFKVCLFTVVAKFEKRVMAKFISLSHFTV